MDLRGLNLQKGHFQGKIKMHALKCWGKKVVSDQLVQDSVQFNWQIFYPCIPALI